DAVGFPYQPSWGGGLARNTAAAAATVGGAGCSAIRVKIRCACSSRHRLRSSVVAKVLRPPDCRTHADVELLGCLSSRSARFHEINNPHSKRARIGSPHRSSPRRITLRLADSAPLVNPPIHPGRDML